MTWPVRPYPHISSRRLLIQQVAYMFYCYNLLATITNKKTYLYFALSLCLEGCSAGIQDQIPQTFYGGHFHPWTVVFGPQTFWWHQGPVLSWAFESSYCWKEIKPLGENEARMARGRMSPGTYTYRWQIISLCQGGSSRSHVHGANPAGIRCSKVLCRHRQWW